MGAKVEGECYMNFKKMLFFYEIIVTKIWEKLTKI